MQAITKCDTTIFKTVHKAADIFPNMSNQEYADLKEDIRVRGQQVPIVIQNGYLIDGRHRYRACVELGIAPLFTELPVGEEPVERLVISLNLHRRHLSESQRALIAAKMATTGVGTNQHTAGAVSQQQAASEMKVSVDSLQRAKSVLNLGSDELIDAVQAGKLDISNAAQIATLSEAEQKEVFVMSEKEILDTAKAIRKEKNAERRTQTLASIAAKRANNVLLDPRSGPYGVVYADPPWDYLNETSIGYPTMTLEDICTMPVNQIAAEDAVLFLWCSASLMREALAVIDAWGFNYKTQAVWNKGTGGQGCYFRLQHEVLMLATRGNVPEVPPTARPTSVFSFPRREHSRKPDYGYELIEQMYPELNKIELFCRGEGRKNWHGFGNEYIGNNAMVEQIVSVSEGSNLTTHSPTLNISTTESANDDSIVDDTDVEFTEKEIATEDKRAA